MKIEEAKKYRDIVYRIIGAAMKVHENMPWGLLEAVYEEALAMELDERGIKSTCQVEVPVFYKNRLMKKSYRMDMVVGDIVIELKSACRICSAHRAQLCNYLRLTHKPVGIIINFGASSLQGERWVYIQENNECILVDKAMNPVYLEVDPFGDGSIFREND